MRALTTAQPYAQLTARGLRPYEARLSTTDYRGRLAIHAAGHTAVPSTLFADALQDPVLGDYLGHFGWRTAEAVAALPRSAIVATVELVGIVPYHEDGFTPPMVGEPADGDYIWELRDAVEITPIVGVRGKPNLWQLDDALTAQVVEAERVARTKAAAGGQAGNTPIPRELEEGIWGSVSHDAEFWMRMVEQQQEQLRRDKDHDDDDMGEWTFREDRFEELFQRFLKRYLLTHQLRGEGAAAEVRVDQRNPMMRTLFQGAEWVPREKFARVIRRALYEEDAPMHDPKAEHTSDAQSRAYFGWSAWDEMDKLSRFVDGGGGRGVRALGRDDLLKQPGGRPRKG